MICRQDFLMGGYLMEKQNQLESLWESCHKDV